MHLRFRLSQDKNVRLRFVHQPAAGAVKAESQRARRVGGVIKGQLGVGRRGRQIHRRKGDGCSARVGIGRPRPAGNVARHQQGTRVRAGIVGVDIVFLAQRILGRDAFLIQIGIVENAHAAAVIAAVRRSRRLLRCFGGRFRGGDRAQILGGLGVNLGTAVWLFAAAAGRQGDQSQRQTKGDFP